MLANDLANKLKTVPLTGSPAIRVANLEPDIKIGVVVKTPLGGLMTTPEMPGYISGAIQIIVRHNDPMAGDALAREVIAALTIQGRGMTLENYRLKCFYPTSEPVMFPVNLAALFEFSINFQCRATVL